MASAEPDRNCSSIDASFGPWARQCRGGFDFTLLFEETILILPLASIFLALFPLRWWYLSRHRKNGLLTKTVFANFKQILITVWILTELVLLVLWSAVPSQSGLTRTSASIPTAVLSFTAAVASLGLARLENSRSIRPSPLLDKYLFFSILFDAARTRTLWLTSPVSVIAILTTCSVALRSVLAVVASSAHHNGEGTSINAHSKEEMSGSYSRSVFFWLSSLFTSGYQRLLSLEDLYPLDAGLQTEKLHETFECAWVKCKANPDRRSLIKTWAKVHIWDLLLPVLPRICLIGFRFAQPLMLTRAIQLASAPDDGANDNIGYGLIGAYAIVYSGIAISQGQYQHWMNRAAVRMRGSIVPSVFAKTLRIPLDKTNTAEALSHINTDIETIFPGITMLHEVWAGLVEIGIAIYLLFRQIGAASAISIVFSLVMLVCTGFLAVPIGTGQAAWIEAAQLRVASTSNALSKIQGMRLSGVSDSVFTNINDLRKNELAVSRKFRILMIWVLTMATSTPIFSPVLTFVTYALLSAKNNDPVTVSKIFTSLSLFTLLSGPLSMIMVTLPAVAAAFTSFGRIQIYLNAHEHGLLHAESPPGLNEKSFTETALNLTNTVKPGSELSTEAERHEDQKHTTDTKIITLDGCFSWPGSDVMAFNLNDLAIPYGMVTFIVGPVGCSKTTVLKCILNELSGFEGTITNRSSSVALCTRGVRLSGGQKQRLALARAVYSRSELVILDDSFSGLDSRTEESVFEALLGSQGLLRRDNITVILTSSNVKRTFPTDWTIVLTSSGSIASQGYPGTIWNECSLPNASRMNSLQNPASSSPSHGESRESEQRINDSIPREATNNPYLDERRQRGDLSVYRVYFRSAGIFPLVLFVCAMIALATCEVLSNFWLNWWAEANLKQPNQNLEKWLSVYAALAVVSMASFLIGTWQIFIVCITNSGMYFHDMLTSTVSCATMDLFSAVDIGVTINRFSQDLQLIDMELPSNALVTASTFISCVGQAVTMSIASKYFAITIPFICAVFFCIQHFYLRTSRQLRFLDIEWKAPLYAQLLEMFDGLATIRAFGWESQYLTSSIEKLDDSQRPVYLLMSLQQWLIFCVQMVVAVMAIILITITTTLRQQMSPGMIGIAMVNIINFGETMKALIQTWVGLEISVGAVARVKNFVSETKLEPQSVEDDGNLRDDLLNWPDEGEIYIENLTASYATTDKVLNGISLAIKPNEKVGICGRTGCGKSSLLYALLHMIPVNTGSIKIDGISTTSVSPSLIRQRIVAVPQEVYIFPSTVRRNLDILSTHTDEGIIEALQRVQLWTTSISPRGGLDAQIDDKFFSHGQAQLFALARAILRKPKVLLLDEVTTSLDSDTTIAIRRIVEEEFRDVTVLAVAHQLDFIEDFDRVVVMDKGRIVEVGDPRQLITEEGGWFRRLAEVQRGDQTRHRQSSEAGVVEDEITMSVS